MLFPRSPEHSMTNGGMSAKMLPSRWVNLNPTQLRQFPRSQDWRKETETRTCAKRQSKRSSRYAGRTIRFRQTGIVTADAALRGFVPDLKARQARSRWAECKEIASRG